MMFEKTSMAAQYTEITLEDMEKFLNRGFRSLRPRKGDFRGEVTYTLHINRKVGIRIMTSIRERSESSARVGKDTIKAFLISLADGKGLEKKENRQTIVKRTQNWRKSLQDRIENLMEKYEEKAEFWDEWAVNRSRKGDPEKAQKEQEVQQRQEERQEEEMKNGPQPTYEKPRGTITDKQLNFLNKVLLPRVRDHEWDDIVRRLRLSVNDKGEISTLSKQEGIKLITVVKDLVESTGRLGPRRRWAADSSSEYEGWAEGR